MPSVDPLPPPSNLPDKALLQAKLHEFYRMALPAPESDPASAPTSKQRKHL